MNWEPMSSASGDAACNLLHLVGDVDAEAAAGTEQTVERAFLSGRDDDENIAIPPA